MKVVWNQLVDMVPVSVPVLAAVEVGGQGQGQLEGREEEEEEGVSLVRVVGGKGEIVEEGVVVTLVGEKDRRCRGSRMMPKKSVGKKASMSTVKRMKMLMVDCGAEIACEGVDEETMKSDRLDGG